MCVKFDIPDSTQSPDGGISNFQISGLSTVKVNCHNSRTRDDTDMKLRPVTKRNKRNKTTSKKFDNDDISTNCDVIAIFSDLRPIWCNLEAGFQMHSL